MNIHPPPRDDKKEVTVHVVDPERPTRTVCNRPINVGWYYTTEACTCMDCLGIHVGRSHPSKSPTALKAWRERRERSKRV